MTIVGPTSTFYFLLNLLSYIIFDEPLQRRLVFRLVHQNCLIFGTNFNLGNTYTLEILKFFEQFVIPSNPLNHLKKAKKIRFSQLFFRFVPRNSLIFGTKVNVGNTYILEFFILFEQFLIPSNPPS